MGWSWKSPPEFEYCAGSLSNGCLVCVRASDDIET